MVRGAVEATELVHQQKADGHCRRIVEMLQRSKNFGATLPEVTQMSRSSASTAPQGGATRTELDERSAPGAVRESGASITRARQPVRGNPGRKPGDASSAVRVEDAPRTALDKRGAREGDASVVPAQQPGRGKSGQTSPAARRKRQRNANRAAARAPGTHQGEVAAPQRGRKQGRAIAQGQRHVLASKAAVRLTCHAVAVSRSVGGHRARKATD